MGADDVVRALIEEVERHRHNKPTPALRRILRGSRAASRPTTGWPDDRRHLRPSHRSAIWHRGGPARTIVVDVDGVTEMEIRRGRDRAIGLFNGRGFVLPISREELEGVLGGAPLRSDTERKLMDARRRQRCPG